MYISQGWLSGARQSACDHCDARPTLNDISLLVIHNISLPPGHFGSPYIEQFFAGKLQPQQHDFFKQIYKMRVSSHLLIKRDGEVVQFVPFEQRAWHAGVSSFQGRTRCNDFSIGIELEGTDNSGYTTQQYEVLARVTCVIMLRYPHITLGRIVGHNDIAPKRKTDPGESFDWCRFRQMVCNQKNNHKQTIIEEQ